MAEPIIQHNVKCMQYTMLTVINRFSVRIISAGLRKVTVRIIVYALRV